MELYRLVFGTLCSRGFVGDDFIAPLGFGAPFPESGKYARVLSLHPPVSAEVMGYPRRCYIPSAGRHIQRDKAGLLIVAILSFWPGCNPLDVAIRPVKLLAKSKPTLESAGVHLRRAFGFSTTSEFDPFLLLDDFRNDIPEDYQAGFPWHPHRGIETITYVLAGTVEHGDSLGNQGAIAAGDVQ